MLLATRLTTGRVGQTIHGHREKEARWCANVTVRALGKRVKCSGRPMLVPEPRAGKVTQLPAEIRTRIWDVPVSVSRLRVHFSFPSPFAGKPVFSRLAHTSSHCTRRVRRSRELRKSCREAFRRPLAEKKEERLPFIIALRILTQHTKKLSDILYSKTSSPIR